jgi:hypothetical protein
MGQRALIEPFRPQVVERVAGLDFLEADTQYCTVDLSTPNRADEQR